MVSFYKSLSITLFSSCLAIICSIYSSESTSNVGGITVDLTHRDSPLSPLHDPSKTRFQHLKTSFDRSLSRLRALKLAPTSCQFNSPIFPVQGEYLMKIRIGSPPLNVLAIVDTGSDLTWIQCTPCPDCYKQNAPLFDPTKSKTYKNVSCSSKQCLDVGSSCQGKPNSSVCQYQVYYGDGSVTDGNLAVEMLGFDPISGQNASFSDVAIGCGHKDNGIFFKETSGIVGLGGGAVSVIRQLESSINGIFSYCLTSPDSNVSSKISFGSEAVVKGPNVVSTPLVKGDSETFYYVTLEGFSVGNSKFEFSKVSNYSNTLKIVEEGNMFIDTGTTFTVLQRRFYDDLESLLVKAVNGSRVSDPRGTKGLCYTSSGGGEVRWPPVKAHFRGGAEVELQKEGVFVEVEKGVVCLSMVPTDLGIMIFGNLNQINYLVGFDLVNEKVNFLQTDCSKNQT